MRPLILGLSIFSLLCACKDHPVHLSTEKSAPVLVTGESPEADRDTVPAVQDRVPSFPEKLSDGDWEVMEIPRGIDPVQRTKRPEPLPLVSLDPVRGAQDPDKEPEIWLKAIDILSGPFLPNQTEDPVPDFEPVARPLSDLSKTLLKNLHIDTKLPLVTGSRAWQVHDGSKVTDWMPIFLKTIARRTRTQTHFHVYIPSSPHEADHWEWLYQNFELVYSFFPVDRRLKLWKMTSKDEMAPVVDIQLSQDSLEDSLAQFQTWEWYSGPIEVSPAQEGHLVRQWLQNLADPSQRVILIIDSESDISVEIVDQLPGILAIDIILVR